MNTKPNSTTNSDALVEQRKALDSTLRTLGKDSIGSELSKPKMALTICRAAADGIISEADAPATYEKYLEGRSKGIAGNALLAGNDSTPGSIKANVSKNLQLIKLGNLPRIDGPKLLDDVIDARTAAVNGDIKVKPAFDALVDAARAQLGQPGTPLTPEQIDGVIRKKESAAKEAIDKLIDAYKRVYKLHDELPSKALEDAVHSLADAIRDAGGEVPAMTKEGKKEQEALAFLQSRGYDTGKAAVSAVMNSVAA